MEERSRDVTSQQATVPRDTRRIPETPDAIAAAEKPRNTLLKYYQKHSGPAPAPAPRSEPQEPKPPPPPKRPPGRPRKVVPLALDLTGETVEDSKDPEQQDKPAEVQDASAAETPAAAEKTDGPVEKRRKYKTWPNVEKEFALEVAASIGTRSLAARYLSQTWPSAYGKLQESHLRSWQGVKGGGVKKRPGPKPLLSAAVIEEISKAVKAQVQAGVEVSSPLVRPLVEGVLVGMGKEAVLRKYGGRFHISTAWINKLCRCMGLRMRRGTTAAQKLPSDWEEKVKDMLFRMAVKVSELDLKPSLVVNIDQTGIHLLPTRGVSRAEKGVKDVPLIGMEDKRQYTAVFGASMNGDILKPQLIFQGATNASLPTERVTSDEKYFGWHFTATSNHWANLLTMQQYCDSVLVPYFDEKRKDLKLAPDHPCLLNLDCWSVHRSKEFRSWLKEKYPWLYTVFVPAGCTGKAQLIDVAVNKAVKSRMRLLAHQFLAEQVREQIAKGTAAERIAFETGMRALRDKVPEWTDGGLAALTLEMIMNGVKKIGIDKCWDLAFQNTALRAKLKGEVSDAADLDPAGDEPQLPATELDYGSDYDIPLAELATRERDEPTAGPGELIREMLEGDEVASSSDGEQAEGGSKATIDGDHAESGSNDGEAAESASGNSSSSSGVSAGGEGDGSQVADPDGATPGRGRGRSRGRAEGSSGRRGGRSGTTRGRSSGSRSSRGARGGRGGQRGQAATKAKKKAKAAIGRMGGGQ